MVNDLTGRRLVITSGPTHAPIDAVRFIANASTGELGACIAAAALDAGAEVRLVCGPGSVLPEPHDRLTLLPVRTVDDVLAALRHVLASSAVDAVVHAMAVLDYVPAGPVPGKIASDCEGLTLKLVPTPKVIDAIREWAPASLLVGFKLLVDATQEALQQAAIALIARSGADLVVANDLASVRRGEHTAVLVDRAGRVSGPHCGKQTIAQALVGEIAVRLAERRGSAR